MLAAAVVASLVCAGLAVRALGETDLNPVSGIGKVAQLLFALLAPGHRRRRADPYRSDGAIRPVQRSIEGAADGRTRGSAPLLGPQHNLCHCVILFAKVFCWAFSAGTPSSQS